jgi:hypothetical protein
MADAAPPWNEKKISNRLEKVKVETNPITNSRSTIFTLFESVDKRDDDTGPRVADSMTQSDSATGKQIQ